MTWVYSTERRWCANAIPHLYKEDGRWVCKFGIYSQTGSTPREAYDKRMAQK